MQCGAMSPCSYTSKKVIGSLIRMANCCACVRDTETAENTREIEAVQDNGPSSISNGKKSSQTRHAFDR